LDVPRPGSCPECDRCRSQQDEAVEEAPRLVVILGGSYDALVFMPALVFCLSSHLCLVIDHELLLVSSRVLISGGTQSRELLPESTSLLQAAKPELSHVASSRAQAIKPRCNQNGRSLCTGNSTRDPAPCAFSARETRYRFVILTSVTKKMPSETKDQGQNRSEKAARRWRATSEDGERGVVFLLIMLAYSLKSAYQREQCTLSDLPCEPAALTTVLATEGLVDLKRSCCS
jgi:hypothetical protein